MPFRESGRSLLRAPLHASHRQVHPGEDCGKHGRRIGFPCHAGLAPHGVGVLASAAAGPNRPAATVRLRGISMSES